MKNIYEAVGKIRTLFDDVQQYVGIAIKNESDDPLEVLLPFGYQYLSRKETDAPDQQALMLVGNYFATKYPHLKEYFISDRQLESQEHLENLLTEVFDGRTETKET